MIPDERHPLFNAIDRSKQYARASNEELLRSLNELWKTSRLNEQAIRDRDRQIAELHQRVEQRDKLIADFQLKVKAYRVGYTTLVAIITGVCWEGVRALVPIVWAVLR